MNKAKFMSFACSMFFVGGLFLAAFYFELAAYGAAAYLPGACGCMTAGVRLDPKIENPIRRQSQEPGFVALTFDDGPSEYTVQLLDALSNRAVALTFFTTGTEVNAYPHIANRIVQEGHEIACHAYSHSYLTELTADEIRAELANSRDAIYTATGVFPALHRPPYSSYDSLVRSIAEEFGMPLILWNVDTIDWRDRDVELILSRIINFRGYSMVQSGDIILMHDTLPTTVDAALIIIDKLQEQGFQFVTVSQLFEKKEIELIPGAVYGCAR